MKTYIKTSKRSDLINEKNQWRMKYDARRVLYEDQEKRFNEAADIWENQIANKIKRKFKQYFDNIPGIEIYVDGSYDSGSNISRIIIDRTSYGGESSVNWEYTICIYPDGNTKTICSWSNGRVKSRDTDVIAVLNELAYSTQLLKEFANLDWVSFLSDELSVIPKKKQFISVSDPDYDPDYRDPGYDNMLMFAELDQIIGKDLWFKTTEDEWVRIISKSEEYYTYNKVDHLASNMNGLRSYIRELKDNNLNDYYGNTSEFLRACNPSEPITLITTDELIESLENKLSEIRSRIEY